MMSSRPIEASKLAHALRLGISGDADVLVCVLESRVGLVNGQRLGVALALWAVLAALETGSSTSQARPRARDCARGDRWPGRARGERSPSRRGPRHERPPRSHDGDVGGHGERAESDPSSPPPSLSDGPISRHVPPDYVLAEVESAPGSASKRRAFFSKAGTAEGSRPHPSSSIRVAAGHKRNLSPKVAAAQALISVM